MSQEEHSGSLYSGTCLPDAPTAHPSARGLDSGAVNTQSQTRRQRIGPLGEKDAHFYVRRTGYVMVARIHRSHRHHGQIDLIGWDHGRALFH